MVFVFTRNIIYEIRHTFYTVLMLKYERIREEDYWLFPIIFIDILAGAIAIYASVLTFRVPALIIFCLGLWFTFNKIQRDYSPKRGRIHVASTVLLSALLTLGVHVLTN